MRPVSGFIIRVAVSEETVSGRAGDFGRTVSGPLNSVSWENGDQWARDQFECATAALSNRVHGIGGTIRAGVRKDE